MKVLLLYAKHRMTTEILDFKPEFGIYSFLLFASASDTGAKGLKRILLCIQKACYQDIDLLFYL
jgi:hypothetical protein